MFVRVKYLVIIELTITTLFALVLVKRHQMSCCRFPSFPAGALVTFWDSKNPPAAFLLLLTTLCSRYQSDVFQNHRDNVKRAARILPVPTMHSMDILQQANQNHLDQVHSDQMVLEMIRLRSW
jgi:hypothetical protein